MTDYSDLEAKAAGTTAAPADSYGELQARASGQTFQAPPGGTTGVMPVSQALPENPINAFVGGAVRTAMTDTAGAIGGGLKGLWDLALGRGSDAAASDVSNVEQKAAYEPPTAAGRLGAKVAQSDWNPLNWPGVAISKTGQFLGDTAERMGAPPIVSTALDVAPAAAASAFGLRYLGKGATPYEVEAESTAPKAAQPPVGPQTEVPTSKSKPGTIPVDNAPIEGGLPESAQAERRAILERVGIVDKRTSAVAGDAQSAATDYQSTKFDEPAGRAMAAQFEQERDALAGFTQRLISKVGGTVGMDEDSLNNRGATIAQPFDALRDWFKERTKQLYAQADAKAGGAPITDLSGVDKLMEDPRFSNALLAKGQGNLLSATKSVLESFRDNSGGGFNAATAEQFRQWLNQTWTKDNSWGVGQLKDAVDEDVLKGAGENVYAAGRAMRTLKRQVLDDPQGVSQLFDHDPNTPINRVTPLGKIPDRLMELPAPQFENLWSTLKMMPEELQPQAQAAMGEVKGQLLNRLLKAGTETRSGRGAQVWKGEDVSTSIARHAAKLRIAFQDDPEAQAAIKDLNSAGQILRVDQGYPGAYAQAANATKRGLGAAVIKNAARIGGAAVGGMVGSGVGLPGVGAAAGEMAGNVAGESMAASSAEKAALKAMRSRIETRP